MIRHCNRSILAGFIGAMVFVATAFAQTPSTAPGAGGSSIVNNGGFEEWRAAPGNLQKSMNCPQTPADWNVQTGADRATCALARDGSVKHGGDASARLSSANTKTGLSIAQRFDAEPECRYVIRLWLKGDHIDAYHPKGVVVHAVASTQTEKKDISLWTGVLRYSPKSPSPNSGTFNWHEFVMTLDTPVDTRSILLLVELRGAGVAWVDDVQVTRLEKCKQVESY